MSRLNPVLQEELLAFLLDPHSYPHRPRYVRLKQTHSSYVLLATPYAYKITISRPAFETIRFYTDNFCSRNANLFETRIREQRIRDCHGDLHLEHIHISPTTLSIYDCVEFNDRFRYIDVANDVAFLAMDLDFHGRPVLSRQFTEKIVDALDDRGMLHLMDFYKCYRAYVRGKVETFHPCVPGSPEPERSESRARAGRYFRLAVQYVVCESEPMVIIAMGRAASGKSTLARSLGRELGWEVFSSDHIRKKLAGVPLYKRCGPPMRRRLYPKAMTTKTYGRLLQNAMGRLKERRSLIIDATFSSRQHRDELGQKLGALEIAYCFIETQASDETLKKRLIERERKANEVSDARLEDFERLTRSYEAPAEVGQRHLIAVDTERSAESTVVETLKALAQRTLGAAKK